MNEEKSTEFKVETIDRETIVPIKVSGAYYITLQQMFMDLAMQKSPEEFKKVMERLKGNNPPQDRYESHLHILLSLIFEIENSAKENGLTKKVDVDTSKLSKID